MLDAGDDQGRRELVCERRLPDLTEEIRSPHDAFPQTILLVAVRSLLDSITAQDLVLLAESKLALLATVSAKSNKKKGNADSDRNGDPVKLDRAAVDSSSSSHYLKAHRRLATNRHTPPNLSTPLPDPSAAVPPSEPIPDPKISIYYLAVDVEEVPLSEVVDSKLSLSFRASEWDDAGEPVFGRSRGQCLARLMQHTS